MNHPFSTTIPHNHSDILHIIIYVSNRLSIVLKSFHVQAIKYKQMANSSFDQYYTRHHILKYDSSSPCCVAERNIYFYFYLLLLL